MSNRIQLYSSSGDSELRSLPVQQQALSLRNRLPIPAEALSAGDARNWE